MLYEELLEFSKEHLKEYFKNVSTFENQFEWSDFNCDCYNAMYLNNSYTEYKSVKDLKSEITELAPMCKKCADYFMTKRNDSKVKYDVQMGQQFENLLIRFLKEKCHINAMHGDTSNKKYPDCMILGPDKGILAYFEVKYHAAPFVMANRKINRFCYEGSTTLDYKKVIKQLEIIESDIERPVFYLHWIDYPCLKGVFFETSEQVKDYIYNPDVVFERKHREGDDEKNPQSVYLHKIYSPTLAMGTFEEFIDIIKNMKG